MKRNRIPADPRNYPELEAVKTAEAMAEFIGVYRSTIYRAIDDGRLAAVKCGKVWLVSVSSAKAVFWIPGTARLKPRVRRCFSRKIEVGSIELK